MVLPIAKGEFVLTSKLAGENAGSGLPSLIPPGMRAVSVRVNDTTSVSGFVLPGTRVDVLLTGNPQGSNEQQTTTVLENVAVIATGQRLERNSAGEAQSAPVVTLLVSPDDAERLTLASSQGHIQLALRNPLDTKQEDVAAVKSNSLYKDGSEPAPAAAPRSRPKHVAVQAPPSMPDRLHGRGLQGRQEGRGEVLSASQGVRLQNMSICSRKWENREMRAGKLVGMTFGILLLLCAIAVTQSQEQPTPQAAPPQPATSTPQAAPPEQSAPQAAPSQAAPQGPAATAQTPSESESHGAAPLRVMVGKSLLINTTERLKRVSVTDPGVADAIVVTPTQILVHGRSAGEVSLLIWDELERSRSFDLRVDVDVSATAEEEKRVFPDEQITVTPSRSAIVLSGHVSTEDIAKRAG